MLRILSQGFVGPLPRTVSGKAGLRKSRTFSGGIPFRRPISSLRGKFGARLAPPVVPDLERGSKPHYRRPEQMSTQPERKNTRRIPASPCSHSLLHYIF